MNNQKIHIVEFDQLYHILDEVKDYFSLSIKNYSKAEDFLKLNNLKSKRFFILTKKNNKNILENKDLDKRAIFFFKELPIGIDKIVEKINIELIKQKYNHQSKINIKSYIVNLNSRTILKDNKNLKLTEKEIDILLFLNSQNQSQSVISMQNKVWGYSSELETHTVETHIYRLRKKIKDFFNDNNFIKSDDNGYSIL
tara:strand:- start:1294 stop:1884 length:591 start_codon:yes stop_codon:yes gene_type:complete